MVETMKKSRYPWYREFFAANGWVAGRAGAISAVGKNANSFCFGRPGADSQDEAWETLKAVFPFLAEGGERIERKFREAVGGDGREWRRICRLHSSSLLAFLAFVRVSPQNPLSIELPDGRREVFGEVFFEVKNPLVPGDRHPSNVDVVLANDNALVFLESKFTEYFARTREYALSRSGYVRKMQQMQQMQGAGVTLAGDRLVAADGGKHYLGGVKQMLAHAIGLEYALKTDSCNLGGARPIPVGGRRAYLGEIVFDFPFPSGRAAFNDWATLYASFAKGLAATIPQDAYAIFPALLTYRQLFDGFPLDSDVRQFLAFHRSVTKCRAKARPQKRVKLGLRGGGSCGIMRA